MVGGGATVVVVVEVVVCALYKASFLQNRHFNAKCDSIDQLTKSNYLNQYLADDLQFTSETK